MDTEVVGLGRYAAAVRRRAWVVVAFTLVLAAAAFGYTSTRPAQYAATAKVLIRPYSAAQFAEPDFTTEQVATQVAVLQSLAVAAPVVTKLGLDESPTTLLKSVTAAAEGDTSVVDVSVTRQSPQLAARIANELGQSYLTFRAAQQPAGTKSSSPGVIVSVAQPPLHPAGRSAVFGGVLGGVIGLILGCIAAIILAGRNRSIEDESTLADVTGGLPVLARISKARSASGALAMVDNPGSGEALAYRFLATTVGVLDQRRNKAARGELQPTVVLVASAAPGEGRTSVAANLALAAAAAGQRVLLCDADSTNPGLTRLLGLPSEVSFDSAVRGNGSVDPNRLAAYAPGLLALGVRETTPDQPLFPGDGSFSRFVTSLTHVVDMVVLDSSPLLSSAAALALVADADLVLLTVRERSSQRPDVTAALELIRQVAGTVSGVVVTRSSQPGGTQRPARPRASSPYARRSASTPVAAAASTPPTDLSRR